MTIFGWRVIVIALLASGVVSAGCGPALAQTATFPHVRILAQAAPAPVVTPPAAPGGSSQAPAQPVGLPRLKDYQAIGDLKDIYFDFGKAEIRPVDETILDSNAAWLRAHPDYLLLIEGHCDERGVALRKNEFNLALGERRAEAAMKYLVARGVQPDRITILSYGEERPVCGEQSERCWRQNRRSRFLVKPRSEAARTRE
jgi:peptidoglycan-associated lipoprotein